ncbi:MAG: ATP-binding protein [Bacteroidota bacterium]|nr:ATP-binding protein [Bacteroidota bacterium]
MLKVIITGPESSGKTTLCKALSEHFNISFVEEFSRKYLDRNGTNYTQSDLLEIAKAQLKMEKLATNNQQLSLYDTDLITIKIWSNYKYGFCDSWILEQIEKQRTENRLYLLCKPDIPWEADPLRENSNDREVLFEIYKKELEKVICKYAVIKGKNRSEVAIKKITDLIS